MDRIGRYKIVRELGRGAMGVVYHAIDPNIGRPVAIKTIQLGAVRKPEEQERLRERLFREARSAGMLSHPGIVTIYDVAQEGELAYIAMEYVDGPTLDQLLSGPQPISPAMMFNVLGQTCAALDYAHQKGIVHRDIKPANIMIAADEAVKIADFGIAKITASEQFTVTGSIVGTPHYMSPEQVQGHAVDGRSDQFSVAVIAYEMLTGEKPFTGEHLTTVVYKIVAEEPGILSRLNPTVSGPVEGVMRKAMSKDPEARYATCQEFEQALQKACETTKGWKTMSRGGSLNEPTVVGAAAVPRGPVAIPPARKARASATSEQAPPHKVGFLTFLMSILVVAGLLALIGWQAAPYLAQRRSAQETEAQAPRKTEESPPQKAEAPVPAPPAAAEKTAEPKTEEKQPDEKPSPMAAAESVRKAAPVEEPRRASGAQPVTVITSPGGATAMLDGRTETSCTTPCSIDAAPGRHRVTLSMPGYQVETREVDIGSGPLELPAVVLRTQTGTLMLASTPPGASVSVDGKATGQVTPAQLSLTPGTHQITVEKDGLQSTQTVEIRGGLSTLKIILGQ